MKHTRTLVRTAFTLSLFITATLLGNTATEPASRGDKWELKHQKLVERAKQGDVDLLFVGDSITERWGLPSPAGGTAVWQQNFGAMKAAYFGISGDRTQHVLWRLAHGEFDGLTPKVVVLMIGTNNTGMEKDKPVPRNSVPEAIEGVKAVVAALRAKMPTSKFLLLGIFPRGEKPDDLQRKQVAEINVEIAKLADGKSIQFLDITQKFLQPDGTISKEVMPDFLHPCEKGYQIWVDAIKAPLAKLLE